MARYREFDTYRFTQNNKGEFSKTIFLNLDMIVHITDKQLYRRIYTGMQSSYDVKETYEELKAIVTGAVDPEK